MLEWTRWSLIGYYRGEYYSREVVWRERYVWDSAKFSLKVKHHFYERIDPKGVKVLIWSRIY